MSGFVEDDRVESLKDLSLRNYETWCLLYPGEEEIFEEEIDDEGAIEEFVEAAGNAKELEKSLWKWLVVLDNSSDYAASFEEDEWETLTNLISNQIPHNLPCRLLRPLTKLLCFVTCGYNYSNDDELPPGEAKDDAEDKESNMPSWLKPLFEACERSARLCPHQSGYLHAVDRLLSSQFVIPVKSFVGMKTVLTVAQKIVTGEVIATSQVTIAKAIEVLADNLVTNKKLKSQYVSFAEVWSWENIIVLSQFVHRTLQPFLNNNDTSAENYTTLRPFIELTLAHIVRAISYLVKCYPQEAAQQLLNNNDSNTSSASSPLLTLGLIMDSVFQYVLQRTLPTLVQLQTEALAQAQLDTEKNEETSTTNKGDDAEGWSFELLSSTASLIHSFVCCPTVGSNSNKKISDEELTNAQTMQELFEALQQTRQMACNAMISKQAHHILVHVLVRENSGDHLYTPNTVYLAALLSVFTFATSAQQEIALKEIVQVDPLIIDCLQTHARNSIWTYKKHWNACIQGMTKQCVIARLILCLYFPQHYPSTASCLTEKKRPKPRKKARIEEEESNEKAVVVEEVVAVVVPNTTKILEEALVSRSSSMRIYVLDDWMLCLSCLSSDPITLPAPPSTANTFAGNTFAAMFGGRVATSF